VDECNKPLPGAGARAVRLNASAMKSLVSPYKIDELVVAGRVRVRERTTGNTVEEGTYRCAHAGRRAVCQWDAQRVLKTLKP